MRQSGTRCTKAPTKAKAATCRHAENSQGKKSQRQSLLRFTAPLGQKDDPGLASFGNSRINTTVQPEMSINNFNGGPRKSNTATLEEHNQRFPMPNLSAEAKQHPGTKWELLGPRLFRTNLQMPLLALNRDPSLPANSF